MTRATNLPVEARAFLDALAVGESGGKDDDAAYTVLFGGAHFNVENNAWPTAFPVWPGVWIGGVPTHAAGRYQFEPATWRAQQGRLSLPDFSPVSQDIAAWNLAERVYGVYGGTLADDLAGNATYVAIRLRSTWTSLSPNTFPDRYRVALARYRTPTNV